MSVLNEMLGLLGHENRVSLTSRPFNLGISETQVRQQWPNKHSTLEGLAGTFYGYPTLLMRRRLPQEGAGI